MVFPGREKSSSDTLFFYPNTALKVRLQRSAGRYLAPSENKVATAEEVMNSISEIRDFTESDFPTSPADSFRALSIAKDKKEAGVAASAPPSIDKAQTAIASAKSHIPAESDIVFEHLEKFLAQT